MNKRQMNFEESAALLSRYGIQAEGRQVYSIPAAEIAAEELGYPVAVKPVSEKIIHKSDEGVVFLNIHDTTQLKKACVAIEAKIDGFSHETKEGLLVQKMAEKGFELLIGAKRDPGFGPVTMVGIGGIFVELHSDAAMGIGILTRQDVERMLTNTQIGRILGGFRGQRYDKAKIIDLAVNISKLMAENPDICELDLNPVIVYEEGCAVVDVRLIRDGNVVKPMAEDIKQWKQQSIDAIFNANSVAVIGASRPGTQGGVILKNCMKIKNLYPIHPRLKKIHGLPCYPSLKDLPQIPEVAVFAVNSEKTVRIFEEFCRIGGKGAIIFSDGFAEMGRKDLEQQLVEISERYQVAFIGPNCMGVIDNFTGLNTNYIPERRSVPVPEANCVGVISQSGGIGLELLEMFSADNQNLGKWVSVGNAASAGVPEILAHMGNDPKIKIIAIYLEGVADGLKLMKIGREVAKKKPVLIIKGGTGGGAEAALSHTASLAGSHEAFKACCEQAGFYLVDELTEDPKILVNVLSILTSQPKTSNNRIAVVSVGGGAGILLADQVTEEGMALAEFAPETRRRMKALIEKNLKPEQRSLSETILKNVGNNPIDLFGNCDDERLLESIRIIDQDPNTDVIVAAIYLQVPLLSEYLPERLVELKEELTKPLIISPRGFSEYVDRCRTYMADKKLHTYTVPMMKPLSIAIEIWKKYGHSFLE
ncbi:acetate--CoA ligase family protein [Desulfoprunum benzoelyticum]|uniref:3-hydroxypropionyl-CoA synthetase (ADP-forming) n=1 Tax=Desulfoprunum benzoelyticum TaxID=1506996 RepID=A0A840V1Q0_9BACT|nr:acetate--CoA ligase family protein [Desulfoprunum benzoelyticum]MBB5349594.1 3-hydroxypropionyl-CoA synthetase (ADP-forming) [Desulfoprunum benzoelyticum]MBM9531498.1 acetate--CoA ligase family protein [Desulfoprunum benzoelyticum]